MVLGSGLTYTIKAQYVSTNGAIKSGELSAAQSVSTSSSAT